MILGMKAGRAIWWDFYTTMSSFPHPACLPSLMLEQGFASQYTRPVRRRPIWGPHCLRQVVPCSCMTPPSDAPCRLLLHMRSALSWAGRAPPTAPLSQVGIRRGTARRQRAAGSLTATDISQRVLSHCSRLRVEGRRGLCWPPSPPASLTVSWFRAGEVRVPYISEENHDEDPEIQASQATSSQAASGQLQAAQRAGAGAGWAGACRWARGRFGGVEDPAGRHLDQPHCFLAPIRHAHADHPAGASGFGGVNWCTSPAFLSGLRTPTAPSPHAGELRQNPCCSSRPLRLPPAARVQLPRSCVAPSCRTARRCAAPAWGMRLSRLRTARSPRCAPPNARPPADALRRAGLQQPMLLPAFARLAWLWASCLS